MISMSSVQTQSPQRLSVVNPAVPQFGSKANKPEKDSFQSSNASADLKQPSALKRFAQKVQTYVLALTMGVAGGTIGGYGINQQMNANLQDEVRNEISEVSRHLVTPEVVNRLAPHNVTVSGSVGLIGSGTWFNIGGHTVVVTNAHVANPMYADENGEFTIGTYTASDFDEEPKPLKAEIISRDDARDVAFLRITTPDFKPPQLLDMNNPAHVRDLKKEPLQPGEAIFVVGNPAGLNHSVSSGIVSRVGRPNPWNETQADIQVDAPINGGNSGGAAYDAQGRYIGIPSWGLRNSDGLGAIVSIETVRDYVNSEWWANPGN